jgi:hypothetical protein
MAIELLLPSLMNVDPLSGSERQRYTLGCEWQPGTRRAQSAADSGQIAHYPVHSIADYLALLSLTRMAQLDLCAPLPSITDLFADGCATPVTDSLTGADRAYLKALYSADLEKNLNIERADIHEQMMREIGEN